MIYDRASGHLLKEVFLSNSIFKNILHILLLLTLESNYKPLEFIFLFDFSALWYFITISLPISATLFQIDRYRYFYKFEKNTWQDGSKIVFLEEKFKVVNDL